MPPDVPRVLAVYINAQTVKHSPFVIGLTNLAYNHLMATGGLTQCQLLTNQRRETRHPAGLQTVMPIGILVRRVCRALRPCWPDSR